MQAAPVGRKYGAILDDKDIETCAFGHKTI
jgi:hypothetical protein